MSVLHTATSQRMGTSQNAPARTASNTSAARATQRTGHARWWVWAKRVLVFAMVCGVGWLLVRQAGVIEWHEVGNAIRRIPLPALLLAAALSLASHLLYSSFDLLGRRYTRHSLGTLRVMAITFTSYAFNLNLGPLVGGIAFRFRLYSKSGLDQATTSTIVALSMATNWLGYLLLAGSVFIFFPLALPAAWAIDSTNLRPIGALMAVAALAYLALCLFSGRREVSVRGHDVRLPSGRMAAVQLLVSCANWALMAGIVFALLEGQVAYPTVLGVLLVGAVAGLITHIPAGLGVLEAVFVALLSAKVPANTLLAALLAYRAIYFLAPLGVAGLFYLAMEASLRRTAR